MEQHTRLEEGSENAARQVRELVHELNALLDGSMRCLSLARTALHEADGDEDLVHRLDIVRGALDRMADLVRGAMNSGDHSSALMRRPISLDEAIRHACEVSGDRARELGIEIQIDLCDGFDKIPANRLYVPILNGVRNALDSIERRDGVGLVSVSGKLDGDCIQIRIQDDGEGLTYQVRAHSSSNGMGVGLGLSRSLLAELGGSLELVDREDGKRGAMLNLRVQVARLGQDWGSQEIGA